MSSTEWRERKQYVEVLGRKMAYVESGSGRPIVLLHGNPTSSYLWREVVPALEDLGRCIVPDLIGMGDSDKLDGDGPMRYGFDVHYQHLEALLAELGVDQDTVLVLHDWGSALGFHWAEQHRESVAGIAYMEGIVRPLQDWKEWNKSATPVFQGFRSDAGEDMVLNKNIFIEKVLRGSILRDMSEEEMDEYRRPFLQAQDRWPMLDWPRLIPIGGEPPDVVNLVAGYANWLNTSIIPKLFINAEPGAILIGPAREYCREWPNQREITVAGSHFIQEDSGKEIGVAIANWLQDLYPIALDTSESE